MRPKKYEGSAPATRADPSHHVEHCTAKRSTRRQNTSSVDFDQLSLDRARAVFDALSPANQRLLLASLAAVAAVSEIADGPLALKQAADIAARSPGTLARWAERHGIGKKIGGRWAVDRAALEAFLEGGRP